MFKFASRREPSEEEKLAVAIARSLSLQAAAGGVTDPSSAGQQQQQDTPVGFTSPKIEVRRADASNDLAEQRRANRVAGKEDKEPPLPELSMKVGNKTPDGILITAELKTEWKRCTEEGRITDLEAKEMQYGDLVSLVGSNRRVLLSRRQIEEIRDNAVITGKIVIITDGLIWYLLHIIKKLKWRVWRDRKHIRELEREKHRLEVQVAELTATVRGLEQIILNLKESVHILTVENERLTKAIEDLTKMIQEMQEEQRRLLERICALTKEVEHYKHLYECTKRKEERYRRLWKKCRKDLKETRAAYEHRRKEITDILMKPLPGGGCGDDADENSDDDEGVHS